MAGTGNKTTITMTGTDPGTSAWTGRVFAISGLAEMTDELDDTALSDSFEKIYVDDVIKTEPITIEYFADGGGDGPELKAEYSLQITLTPPKGKTNGATLQGTGYVTRRQGPELRNGVRKTGTFTFRFNGATPPSYTKAT